MDVDHDIRRAVAADAPTVRALVREAYGKWVPIIGREPKPMTADYDAAVRDHLVDLLYVGFDLAGVLELILEADHLLIENLAVAPAWQGKGLGGFLLAHAEAVARMVGLGELWLYTNEKFSENIALYERAGYVITHRQDHGFAMSVHMAKRLEQDGGGPPIR